MALSLLPPTTLPMVTDTAIQVGRALYCEGMEMMFKNVTPFTDIPPFTMVTSGVATVSEVLIVPVDEPTNYLDITALFTFGYDTSTADKFKVFAGGSIVDPTDIYSPAGGGDPLTYRAWVTSYDGGPFYLKVTASPAIQYTEWFWIDDVCTGEPDKHCNHIILEWYDSNCEIGQTRLRYDLGLSIRNKIYLKCDVGKPVYLSDEDGQENGDKEVETVFQKVRKVSKLTCIVPEYITDALALLSLHDTIMLTDQFGDEYQIRPVDVSDPDWTNGCVASVTISYSIADDYAIKRCC